MAEGSAGGVYLVAGELILAEPAAERLARALAERAGVAPEVHRRPARLAPLLDDLRTYSLFAAAKVLLVVDTALLADSAAAAGLVDEAAEALPLSGGSGSGEREAASRLLQALRLFGIDAAVADPAEVVEALPDWALQGGAAFRRGRSGRGRTKNQVAELREGLAQLLSLARELELTGFAEGELAQLAALADGGMPEGYALVLAERSADPKHPLVAALEKAGRVERVGELAEERGGGWKGLDLLADELGRQTRVTIERGALDELARRTLRGTDDRGSSAADSDSAARFAGEYRKLASLATGGTITRALVAQAVEDRGEEDVWKLLDAIGEGRGGEALERLGRMLSSASDPQAERLTFFALLSGFCRQLAAVRGVMEITGVAAGESFYPRFKDRLAPRLQAPLPDGRKNPLAGLHPYRLHRAYLAASRLAPERAARLPWRVLETELMLKGESNDPDTALSSLVAELAGSPAPAGRRPDSSGRRGGGERSAPSRPQRRQPAGRAANRRRAR